MTYCKECFIKQQKINELEAEIASLKYLCSQTESKVQKSSLVCLILYKSQVLPDIVEPGQIRMPQHVRMWLFDVHFGREFPFLSTDYAVYCVLFRLFENGCVGREGNGKSQWPCNHVWSL